MLINTYKLLYTARAGGYAIGAFNSYNLEMTLGIVFAAEKLKSPIILQIGASSMKMAGGQTFLASMLAAARNSKVPVAVHLDHSRDLDLLQGCLNHGISSVMFDGSSFSFSKNVQVTREAVQKADNFGIPVEGEIGGIGNEEGGTEAISQTLHLTDPDNAAKFVEQTNVASLAVAIGNKHGFYIEEPKLDFSRLEEIRKRIHVPIVLHGASGIQDEEIKTAIELGVCKINVNTELRCALFNAWEGQIEIARHDDNLPQLLECGRAAVQDVVETKLTLFGSSGRAEVE